VAVRVNDGRSRPGEAKPAGRGQIGDQTQGGARRCRHGRDARVAGQQARPIVNRHCLTARLHESDRAAAGRLRVKAGDRLRSKLAREVDLASRQRRTPAATGIDQVQTHAGGSEQPRQCFADLRFLYWMKQSTKSATSVGVP